MTILLTNGKFYIAHSNTGAIIKVKDIEQAQDFHSVERAIYQRKKAPGKCAGYYYIDTSENGNVEELSVTNNISQKKRKNFSAKERIIIYRKTQGHCYLCGEFVDFDSFEIEHKLPLSKGGTNELSNVFCACHCCNTIKYDIYPKDFMERISKIYLYQMEKKYRGRIEWKIVHKILNKMI